MSMKKSTLETFFDQTEDRRSLIHFKTNSMPATSKDVLKMTLYRCAGPSGLAVVPDKMIVPGARGFIK